MAAMQARFSSTEKPMAVSRRSRRICSTGLKTLRQPLLSEHPQHQRNQLWKTVRLMLRQSRMAIRTACRLPMVCAAAALR